MAITPSGSAGDSGTDHVAIAASNAQGEAASIDPQVVLERCMGNVAFAETLLSEFESSSRKRATEIARLVLHQRWADLAETAHALKGAAAIVGAERVRALAAAAEKAGRSGEFSRISHVAEELYMEVERCLSDVRTIRENWQRRCAGDCH